MHDCPLLVSISVACTVDFRLATEFFLDMLLGSLHLKRKTVDTSHMLCDKMQKLLIHNNYALRQNANTADITYALQTICS